MLKIVKNNPKKSIATLLAISTPTALILDLNKKIDLEAFTYNFSKYLSGQIRSARCGLTVASIILDYKTNGICHQVHQNSADKLLHLCKLNKGTYVKVGQHVGALDMLLPEEYVQTMKCLFSEAPVSDFEDVKAVLCEDLKINDLSEVFQSFEKDPIGSASLAQVHRATLTNGQKVAVKVQHRKVYESAKKDVFIMDIGLDLASRIFPEFRLEWLVKITKTNLFKELDFQHEFQNTMKAKRLYEEKFKDFLIIPKAYQEFTTKRVLILDFEEGTHIDQLPSVTRDRKRLDGAILKLQKLYGDMLYNTGFIHADPHPGNVLVTDDDKLVLLDHGLYSSVDEKFTYNFAQLWYNLITGCDPEKVKKYCEYFNVSGTSKTNPDIQLHEIFAAMLTNHDYKELMEKKGLGTSAKKIDRDEGRDKLRKNAKIWMYDITEVLQAVPLEFVLIFKTNDLIRSLEYQFHCRANFNTYLSMSELCLHKIKDYKRKKAIESLRGVFVNFKDYLRLRMAILAMFLYKLKLSLSD